jgi:hypothetical protein
MDPRVRIGETRISEADMAFAELQVAAVASPLLPATAFTTVPEKTIVEGRP